MTRRQRPLESKELGSGGTAHLRESPRPVDYGRGSLPLRPARFTLPAHPALEVRGQSRHVSDDALQLVVVPMLGLQRDLAKAPPFTPASDVHDSGSRQEQYTHGSGGATAACSTVVGKPAATRSSARTALERGAQVPSVAFAAM